MGRAEALLSAHLTLGGEDLRTEAWKIAGEVLDRAGEKGLFGCLPVRGGDLHDPSFFLGDSGVGFTLLRLLAPEMLPCPLLLAAYPGMRPAGTSPEAGGE
jgi:lantibiotic modifying enzyme